MKGLNILDLSTNKNIPSKKLFLGEPAKKLNKGFIKGIVLTLVLALVASSMTKLPLLSIMGIMILSIFLGLVWKALMDVPADATPGITFSSKILLRAGIILMGLRINLSQIIEAGFSVILIDIVVIVFTLTFMLLLGKWLKLDRHLSALIAVGTAVCGAAAIVAVAPLIGARKEQTALSVACIAVLGTIGSVMFILLFPYLGNNTYEYGVLVGATLQELAHVLAAAVPGGGTSEEIAILVKLGRVALLIPVAIILGLIFTRKSRQHLEQKSKRRLKDLPIPWFIFGFLGASLINSLAIIPQGVIQWLIALSVFLLSMAMAGLGLSINLSDFKQAGLKPILVGLIGFIALVLVSPFLLTLL